MDNGKRSNGAAPSSSAGADIAPDGTSSADLSFQQHKRVDPLQSKRGETFQRHKQRAAGPASSGWRANSSADAAADSGGASVEGRTASEDSSSVNVRCPELAQGAFSRWAMQEGLRPWADELVRLP